MACDRPLLDLGSSSSPAEAVLSSLSRRHALLVIAQLDHAQVTAVAALQLLRCHVTGGDGGALALIHAKEWPEVRLLTTAQAATSSRTRLSTLPASVCAASSTSAPHAFARLLDYRCHAPGGFVGVGFPRRLTSCLSDLARSDVSATKMAQTLGATDDSSRSALARAARQLLDVGLEGTLVRLHRGALRQPACCSAAPCAAVRSARLSWFGAAASPPPAPPLPPPPEGLPRHPRPLGLLEPPPAGALARMSAGADGSRASLSAPFYASHRTRDAAARDPGLGGRGAASLSAWLTHTRPQSSMVAKAAAALLADGAGLLPTAFDPRFVNPCWSCNANATDNRAGGAGGAGGGLCCLPYAHILGVSKSGTTDLHGRLAAHPRVLPSTNKGPHFWDAPHTFRWYVGLYASSAARLAAGDAPSDSILLDASSNTLTFTGIGVRGVTNPSPPVTLPHVLRWLQPAAKLMLMLREPGARYYSAYSYYHKRYNIYERFGQLGAAAFGKMALADIGAFSRCRELGATARRCARSVYHEAEQLVKGLYAIFLEGWLDAFPPEQMLIMRLEDYENDLEQHLAAVMRFLQLPLPPRRAWRRMVGRPRANRQSRGEPMLESTRDALRAFYAEHNEHLALLLGDDRYKAWHEGGEEEAPFGTAREPSVYGVVG